MEEAEKKAPRPFYKARSTKIIVTLCVVIVGLVAATPFAIRYAAQSYLLKNGATDAVISSLAINPFKGTVRVGGVHIADGTQKLFASSQVDVDLKLLPLFEKKVEIEKVYIEGLNIIIHQKDDGTWRIASHRTVPNATKEPETEEQPLDWIVNASLITLSNCEVDLVSDLYSNKFTVTHAELSGFSTASDSSPAQFSLKGSVGDAPLAIQLDELTIMPFVRLAGTLSFSNYDLGSLQKILDPTVKDLVGDAGVEGRLVLSMEKAIDVLYDGGLKLDGISLETFGNKVVSKASSWQGKVHYNGGANNLSLDGRLALADTKYSLDNLYIASKELSVEGPLQMDFAKDFILKSDARLKSEQFSLKLDELSYKHNGLNWMGAISFNGGSADTHFNGKLDASGASYAQGSDVPSVDLGAFNWQGKGNYKYQEGHISTGFNTASSLSLAGFKLALPGEMPLDLGMNKASLTGLEITEKSILGGELALSSVNAYSPVIKEDFLRLTSLVLNDISVADTWATKVEKGALGGIALFPAQKGAMVQVGDVRLTGLDWSDSRGTLLKSVDVSGLNVEIVRDKKGNINIAKEIATLTGATESKKGEKTKSVAQKENPAKSSKAGAYKIDKITLTGDKNILSYHDYTLSVPFKSLTKIEKLSFAPLNSEQPHMDSKLFLKALLEKRAPMTVEGTLRPLEGGEKPKKFIELKYSLRNYPLRNLSPYAVQTIGTALDSGELQLTGTFSLDAGVVESKSDLLLKRLETKSISKELAAKVDSKLPIPLDAALALLRDSDGNIELTIPISGPLDDVSFDVSDAIITALGKAVIPAASSYLVYALGPYAALAYVGLKVGENILDVKLPPVQFAYEQVTLTDKNKDYLKRVGTILSSGKTESDVQICPTVNYRIALDDEDIKSSDDLSEEERVRLEELGQTRAKLVRSYLVDSYDINKDRLLLCVTSLKKKGDSEVLLHLDN